MKAKNMIMSKCIVLCILTIPASVVTKDEVATESIEDSQRRMLLVNWNVIQRMGVDLRNLKGGVIVSSWKTKILEITTSHFRAKGESTRQLSRWDGRKIEQQRLSFDR